jgi:hypothetical protein
MTKTRPHWVRFQQSKVKLSLRDPSTSLGMTEGKGETRRDSLRLGRKLTGSGLDRLFKLLKRDWGAFGSLFLANLIGRSKR